MSPRLAHGFLLLVLLLALSWQGYLAGTHVHARSGFPILSGAVGYSLEHAPAEDRRVPISPDTCPICQEIATGGVYLPAPPVDIVAPIQAPAWYLTAIAWRALPRQHSHAWRSRGPPAAPTF